MRKLEESSESKGSYVDLTQILPSKAKVVSITLYCPMDVKVSKGKYTFIDNYTGMDGFSVYGGKMIIEWE